MDGMFDLGVAEVHGFEAMRHEVRDFAQEEQRLGTFHHPEARLTRFSPDFSRRFAAGGWIGMTWPKQDGGRERCALERHSVTEELLAAGAAVRAHCVAEPQRGPLLLRFGTEARRMRVLPHIVAGKVILCIGMSEPDSSSDLASICTWARQVEDGWRVSGTKPWTSTADRAQMMILFARTGDRGEDRHDGVTPFLVDMTPPGPCCSGRRQPRRASVRPLARAQRWRIRCMARLASTTNTNCISRPGACGPDARNSATRRGGLPGSARWCADRTARRSGR